MQTTCLKKGAPSGRVLDSRSRGCGFEPHLTIEKILFCIVNNANNMLKKGAPSGRVLDSRSRGCGFEPHRRHCIASADPEGGTGGPDPLENHKLYGFLKGISNWTPPPPWKKLDPPPPGNVGLPLEP